MGRKLKIDTGEPKLGPYTPGINVKDHIWLSGQIDVDSGDDIASVSYTHLTLPTILLV